MPGAESVHSELSHCCTNWRLNAVPQARRYQLSWAGPQFGAFTPQQHIDYANTTQVQRMGSYIGKGGLPAIVGEWSLAGAPAPGQAFNPSYNPAICLISCSCSGQRSIARAVPVLSSYAAFFG